MGLDRGFYEGHYCSCAVVDDEFPHVLVYVLVEERGRRLVLIRLLDRRRKQVGGWERRVRPHEGHSSSMRRSWGSLVRGHDQIHDSDRLEVDLLALVKGVDTGALASFLSQQLSLASSFLKIFCMAS